MSRFVTLAALLGASRNYGVIDAEDFEPNYAGDGDDDGSDGLVLELSDDDADYGDDDYGDDDYGDDDYGDDDGYGDDDYGRRLSREEREARKGRRKGARSATRADRRDRDDAPGRPPAPKAKKMAMKLIPGSLTLAAAGTGIITVRAQAQYRIVDLVISGLAGSSVQYITNGENNALQAGGSFDITIFGSGSFFRDLLTGQDWNQGTDLVFGVTLAGAGTVSVAVKVEYNPGC